MTRSLLSKIPNDKLDWKPNANLHTIDGTQLHLVEIIGWVSGIVEQSEWDIAPVGGEPYVAPTASSSELLVQNF